MERGLFPLPALYQHGSGAAAGRDSDFLDCIHVQIVVT
jgi:hypothetical protein